jgi:CubicO group peptidase (beta-lactamase class C family)
MARVLLAALAFPVMVHIWAAPGETTKPDFASVQKYIRDHMAAESVPALSIAVSRDGRIVWEEGFGWADRENRIKATAHTPYYLASVTKSLTSAALMLLQERHKLDLDHPVNDYLGAAKVHSPMWDASQATVRRVATHTAGLTTYARSCAVGDSGCRTSTETAIGRYGVLFWPPGDHFDYSNLGYGILGDVVAHASGRSYGDFLHDEIFQPLGMSDCALDINPALRDQAAQYSQPSHTRSPLRTSDHPGASSEHCSVHDLAVFGMFMIAARVPGQKAILSAQSRDAILNSTVEAVPGERYGMGWWVNPDLDGYRVVFGSGEPLTPPPLSI